MKERIMEGNYIQGRRNKDREKRREGKDIQERRE